MRAIFLDLFQKHDLSVENFTVENITANMDQLLKAAFESGRIVGKSIVKKGIKTNNYLSN